MFDYYIITVIIEQNKHHHSDISTIRDRSFKVKKSSKIAINYGLRYSLNLYSPEEKKNNIKTKNAR